MSLVSVPSIVPGIRFVLQYQRNDRAIYLINEEKRTYQNLRRNPNWRSLTTMPPSRTTRPTSMHGANCRPLMPTHVS
jgi:hypothetical protein